MNSDLATWDHDGAIQHSEAYRHALRFETGGIPQGEARPGFARLRGSVARPPIAPPPVACKAASRARRMLLLLAAGLAGVASGMLVSGQGGLPDWRALLAQARLQVERLVPGARPGERSPLAGATLTSSAQAETVAVAAPATVVAYAPPPGRAVAVPAVSGAPQTRAAATARRRPGGELFETELVPGVVLAAALTEVPTWPSAAAQLEVRREPPTTPTLERPAPAYRVQLATLRDRRNVGPVWQNFVRRFGPPGEHLEHYVTTAETPHGPRFLVQVGPFADAPGAATLCHRILQKGGDCLVVPPSS